MASTARNLISMEVKYCENCGGLWIRKQGDLVVYCRNCREVIEARNGALKNTSNVDTSARPLPEETWGANGARHVHSSIQASDHYGLTLHLP